jgi:hypothetical protein
MRRPIDQTLPGEDDIGNFGSPNFPERTILVSGRQRLPLRRRGGSANNASRNKAHDLCQIEVAYHATRKHLTVFHLAREKSNWSPPQRSDPPVSDELDLFLQNRCKRRLHVVKVVQSTPVALARQGARRRPTSVREGYGASGVRCPLAPMSRDLKPFPDK